MGMRELESAILLELRELVKNRAIRKKDMLEWRTGNIDLSKEDSDCSVFLPELKISVVIDKKLDKRK